MDPIDTFWVDPSITIPSVLLVCNIKLLPVVVLIVPEPAVKLSLLLVPVINKSLDRIRIQVFDDCWLEVYSPDKRLLYKLAKKGEDYYFEVPLVKVIAGNSKNIELSYNGERVMLDKLTNKNLVSCVVLPAGECSEFRTPNN